MKRMHDKTKHHEAECHEKNNHKAEQHHLNFDNFEWLSKHKYILEILDDAKFVGGAVKNSLLSLPINDFDVATSHSPEDVTKICQNHGLSVIPTGLSHGTVTVMINGIGYEVTTLRSDVNTDGRHASVEFIKDWRHDAERRDFTINAVYLDKNGEFLDFFSGVKDLRNGIIRFIGSAEKRIQEDYLRILRFFRFFIGYGIGCPDGEALFFCKKYAHCLSGISIERITKEIMTLLNYRNLKNLQTGMQAMYECGVLNEIFRKDGAFKGLNETASEKMNKGVNAGEKFNVVDFCAFLEFEKEAYLEGENCLEMQGCCEIGECRERGRGRKGRVENYILHSYTASSSLLRLFMLSPENWSALCLSNSQKSHIIKMQKAEKAMAKIFEDLFTESFEVCDLEVCDIDDCDSEVCDIEIYASEACYGCYTKNRNDNKDSKNNKERLQVLLPLMYLYGRQSVLDAVMLCFYNNLRKNLRNCWNYSSKSFLKKFSKNFSKSSLKDLLNSSMKNVLKYVERVSMPVFPLLGRDLMKIGIPAGKEIGQIMQKIAKEWLDSNCSMTKNECVKLAKNYYEQHHEHKSTTL